MVLPILPPPPIEHESVEREFDLGLTDEWREREWDELAALDSCLARIEHPDFN
jgi:hypothetical protein